jgi:hypothetical protein
MEEGEAREELTTSALIIHAFDGLLELLVVPQSPAVSSSSQPCIEVTPYPSAPLSRYRCDAASRARH